MLPLLPAILLLILQGPTGFQVATGDALPRTLAVLQLHQESGVSHEELQALLRAAQQDPRVFQALCALFQATPRVENEPALSFCTPLFPPQDAQTSDGFQLLPHSRDGPITGR